MEDNEPPVRVQITQVPVDLTDDNSSVDYTQNVRKNVIDALTAQGTMPTDPETLKVILKAAADMSGAALTKLKIKSEEKIADKAADARALIADMLRQKEVAIALLPLNAREGKAPELGNDLVRPPINPGELDISPPQENVTQFLDRVKTPLVPLAPAVL